MSTFDVLFSMMSPEQRESYEKVVQALRSDPTCLDRPKKGSVEKKEKDNG